MTDSYIEIDANGGLGFKIEDAKIVTVIPL